MNILILGASGQFGRRLCRRLAGQVGVQLFLGGRDRGKLETVKAELAAKPELVVCDIADQKFPDTLSARRINLVIHLAGPFQGQDYNVARACLRAGIPYIDMADGREFVTGFSSTLDAAAREKQIPLVTGASTVPGLSSAIIDTALDRFSQLRVVDYGIGAGLKTGLGLATLRAVLSYCGKPYSILRNGKWETIYGLAEPRTHDFPDPVYRRHIVNCDIPDHSLFPVRYPTLKQMGFGSCLDVPGLARMLSLMSFCVRKGWIANWDFLSGFIEPFMNALKPLGSPHSGFFMRLEGQDKQGNARTRILEIMARDGSGLEIPVTPVVLLVKKLLRGEPFAAGAYPCMGLFSLAEFEKEVSAYPISWNWKDA